MFILRFQTIKNIMKGVLVYFECYYPEWNMPKTRDVQGIPKQPDG